MEIFYALTFSGATAEAMTPNTATGFYTEEAAEKYAHDVEAHIDELREKGIFSILTDTRVVNQSVLDNIMFAYGGRVIVQMHEITRK